MMTPDVSHNALVEPHHLSPQDPWSPKAAKAQDFSEGDLDISYQRELDDPWALEWDNLVQHLSFLQPPNPPVDAAPEEWDNPDQQLSFLQPPNPPTAPPMDAQQDEYCLFPHNPLPHRRHSFNGFVLPTTFTRSRIQYQ
jgi:hypothetical protein